MTREQVMIALLARLGTAHDFKTLGRRNRGPEALLPNETPALLLLEHSEEYRTPSPSQPPVRRLMVRAIVYSDVGADDNAVPATTINLILDRIDALLKPDDPIRQRCTLGGLVEALVVSGTIVKSPGDVTGKSLAIVPIEILLP